MALRVLHVGCGAIGSYSAPHCPAIVDHLLLCDKDIVEEANIGIANYSRDDIGSRKVDALAARIRHERPSMRTTCLDGGVSRIGPGMIDTVDLVTAALDNDMAAFSLSRIVALSAKQPTVIFANCDPATGAAQVRVINFRANKACIGCNRSRSRWDTPLASPHSCSRGTSRASAEAAQFSAALQVSTTGDLLRFPDRHHERAGESLVINPASGHTARARMTFNTQCPALYHVCTPNKENTVHVAGSHLTLSLNDMLGAVTENLGQAAVLDLGERWWCAHFTCTTCRKSTRAFRLLDSAPRCSCGATMVPLGGSRRLAMSHRARHYADVILADAGFADGDVIPAVSPHGLRFFALDISEQWNDALSRNGAA